MMANHRETRQVGENPSLSLKDKVALVASIVALALSTFGFVQQNLMDQHVLRVMVVGLGGQGSDDVSGDVLVINAGKHYETLYDARIVFATGDLGSNPILAGGGIGPTVIKPGEAIVLKLTGNRPESVKRAVSGAAAEIHVGVRFRAFDKHGTFPNEGKLFRYTVWKYQNGSPVAATPAPGDNDKLIDLL